MLKLMRKNWNLNPRADTHLLARITIFYIDHFVHVSSLEDQSAVTKTSTEVTSNITKSLYIKLSESTIALLTALCNRNYLIKTILY